MASFSGIIFGIFAWFVLKYIALSFYTVQQNERAVKTSFGRAIRLENKMTTDDPISEGLTDEEKLRYNYPQLKVIQPGGPYFKWPWEQVYKVNIAVETVSMAWDPENSTANKAGTELEAVTRDQLNTGLTGQIRFRVSEKNIYAYLFGIKNPLVHVMGFFISILRERIANFKVPSDHDDNISINDIRKNLRDLNESMDHECRTSAARYGIQLDASLITAIDPPQEVESALAAINTAHNRVSSDVSLAQATADQKIVQSRRAVEIETLKALAEVEPLKALANQLEILRANGDEVLDSYIKNIQLPLIKRAKKVFFEWGTK